MDSPSMGKITRLPAVREQLPPVKWSSGPPPSSRSWSERDRRARGFVDSRRARRQEVVRVEDDGKEWSRRRAAGDQRHATSRSRAPTIRRDPHARLSRRGAAVIASVSHSSLHARGQQSGTEIASTAGRRVGHGDRRGDGTTIGQRSLLQPAGAAEVPKSTAPSRRRSRAS